MCGGMREYRGDDVVMPRTAEQLYALRKKQEEDRMKKSNANGDVWQRDYIR